MKGKNSGFIILKTPFFTVVRNLLVLYLCFMLCRIVFIWYNWDVYAGFLDASRVWKMFKGALVFDTSGIMYLSALYIVLNLLPLHFKENPTYYKIIRIIFIIFGSVGILANLMDTVYFQHTGCRSTLSVFREFGNEGSKLVIIMWESLIDNWYQIIVFAVLVWILCRFTSVPEIIRHRRLWTYYLLQTVFLLIGVVFIVGGIRGGFSTSTRPIAMSNAYQYADRPADAAAVLNTPFCAIRTIYRETLTVPEYFNEEELDKIYSPVITPDSTAVFISKNVVVIILESFGAEYVGAMNRGVEGIHDCTPFLNSLIDRSLTFKHSVANGRKSIDAAPAILSGIPMLKDHFILTSTMMSKEITGIARELSGKGYYSAFFHGADNKSMGFQSFARAIGYKDYFGKDEFDREPQYGGHSVYDGVWAIWDEEFLQFMCDKMGTFNEPFVSTVFTASSHHPFNIPSIYEQLYPKEPGLDIYRCVRYSDNALRLFFEKAATQPWYNNTLFVLSADHTNQSEHPDYQSDYGQFRIPIIFFDPSGEIASQRDALAQQSDIMPSILGYLGYDKPFICFGQNLFATPDEETWAANFQNGMYMYYKGDKMIKFDGVDLYGVFDYKNNPELSKNLKGLYPDVEERMTTELKAIIQQYMNYMTVKDLVIKEP